MATRILIQGRTSFASADYRPPRRVLHPTTKDGKLLEDTRVDPASKPFRAGSPYYDADDGIEYRAVGPAAIDLQQGWRTAGFWLDRWNTDWTALRRMVDFGWLDAAIEVGGATKRFRCRDERRVLEWLAKQKLEIAVVTTRGTPLSPKRSKRS